MGNRVLKQGHHIQLERLLVAELNLQQGRWWLGRRKDFPTVRD